MASDVEDYLEPELISTTFQDSDIRCNICFSLLRDPVQCVNRHLFCRDCAVLWRHRFSSEENRSNTDVFEIVFAPPHFQSSFPLFQFIIDWFTAHNDVQFPELQQYKQEMTSLVTRMKEQSCLVVETVAGINARDVTQLERLATALSRKTRKNLESRDTGNKQQLEERLYEEVEEEVDWRGMRQLSVQAEELSKRSKDEMQRLSSYLWSITRLCVTIKHRVYLQDWLTVFQKDHGMSISSQETAARYRAIVGISQQVKQTTNVNNVLCEAVNDCVGRARNICDAVCDVNNVICECSDVTSETNNNNLVELVQRVAGDVTHLQRNFLDRPTRLAHDLATQVDEFFQVMEDSLPLLPSISASPLVEIKCPVCRQSTDFTTSHDTQRLVCNLFVRCPFDDVTRGKCQWTGRYGDYGNHSHTFTQ